MSLKEIDQLLMDARSDNRKDREKAAKELPNRALQLNASKEEIDRLEKIIPALERLSNDSDKNIRKLVDEKHISAVKKHLNMLRAEAKGGKKVETAGSSPKDRWSSGSAEVQSSFSDSSRTGGPPKSSVQESGSNTGGAALKYVLKESVKGNLSAQNEIKDLETTANIEIQNLGKTDRIFDINFAIPNKGSTNLPEEFHINEIQAGDSWKQDYNYEMSFTSADNPLEFKEIINTFSDSEEPSNVLVLGKIMKTSVKYTFKANKFVASATMTKALPSGFTDVAIESCTLGKSSIENDKVVWVVDNVQNGQNGELKLYGSFEIKNLDSISTGTVDLYYNSKEQLFSSAEISDETKRTGSTRGQYYVESDERLEQPDYWDSKFIYENTSEFPITLQYIKISDEKSTYLELKDAIVVQAGAKYESSPWETFTETQPSFDEEIKMTVQSIVDLNSEVTLVLEPTEMRVANIEGSKTYDTTEVPSYRETLVPAHVYVSNIGKVEYETLTITDTIPAHFLHPQEDSINVIYTDPNGQETTLRKGDYEYSYTPQDDNIDVEHTIDIKISKHCAPEGKFVIDYSPRAMKAIPNHDYKSVTKITAILLEKYQTIELELTENIPKLTVVHKRRKLTAQKTVVQGKEPAEYLITISFVNRGSELKNMSLKDFVADEFNIIDEEAKVNDQHVDIKFSKSEMTVKEEEGDVLEWAFPDIKPQDKLEVTYKIVGKKPSEEYHAYKAQMTCI